MTHWYHKDGKSQHTVLTADGKERDTTLRDARKLNLFPSTTGIIKELAAPGLVNWMCEQGVIAGWNLRDQFTEVVGESEEARAVRWKVYMRACMYESQKIAREAREKGQSIHDACQKFVDGEYHLVPAEYVEHCEGLMSALDREFGSDAAWITEESFACREGYAGRSDLGSRAVSALGDIKCKPFTLEDLAPKVVNGKRMPAKKLTYDEHYMQLASYKHGLDYPPNTRLFNVFVSTTVPGLVHIVNHTPEESEFGLRLFNAALAVWHIRNDYKPKW